MRLSGVLLSIALWCAAIPAQSAGVQFFDVPADTKGRPLIGAMWYPCSAPQEEATVRNWVIQGTKDCPLVGDKLPLVVISHGRGGWFGGHHATAAALADAGFIVATIDHPVLKSWVRSLNSTQGQRNFAVTARRFLAELPDGGLRAATVEDVRDGLAGISAGLSEASARQ
jgi:predicted dienelactone hydrolase